MFVLISGHVVALANDLPKCPYQNMICAWTLVCSIWICHFDGRLDFVAANGLNGVYV